MPARPIKLPSDFLILTDLSLRSFHYPDHPDWNSPEEAESFCEIMRNLHRFWPLLRGLLFFSPQLADLFQGYIWEEEGEPVGTIIYQRQGSTATWYISNVGVLPEYRRRGIARHLVEVALTTIQQRGGDLAWLKVIPDNTPAVDLYDRLGFTRVTSDLVLLCGEGEVGPLVPLALPAGYRLEKEDMLEWQTSFQLLHRITPAEVQRHLPVEAAQFQQPGAVRLFSLLMDRVFGTKSRKLVVRAPDNQVVAMVEYSFRLRPGGLNHLTVHLDPAHAMLAPHLLPYSLQTIQQLSPGRPIQMLVAQWQQPVWEAAQAAGCVQQKEFCWMACRLESD